MTDKRSTFRWTVVIFVLALLVAGGGALAAERGQADAEFMTAEVEGSKVWKGSGTNDLKGRSKPLTLKVSNPLAAEHGFAIDTMKVKDVIKPGETKAITVPLENIDQSVSEHRVYCQLHPKHVVATLKVTK